MKMENFEELGIPGTCELCGTPGHKKEKCPYEHHEHREQEETKEKESKETSEDWESWLESLRKRGEEYEAELEYLKKVEEEKPKPDKEKIKKSSEKKKEFPQRLEEVISILADKTTRKVEAAAGGKGAFRVSGEHERKWIKEKFFPRLIKEIETSKEIRAPGDWLIILEEVEKRVPQSAKEFVREYKENLERTMKAGGIL